MKYKIECSPNAELILGDCVVLTAINSKRQFTGLWSRDEEMNAILLPISSRSYLVGSNNDYSLAPESLNIASATLSDAFFISSKSATSPTDLADKIGDNSYIFPKAELEKMAIDIMTGNTSIEFKRSQFFAQSDHVNYPQQPPLTTISASPKRGEEQDAMFSHAAG
jgi:hypothetical protein